jgi:hypothetical protein
LCTIIEKITGTQNKDRDKKKKQFSCNRIFQQIVKKDRKSNILDYKIDVYINQQVTPVQSEKNDRKRNKSKKSK